jgi:predicted dehydrogenase
MTAPLRTVIIGMGKMGLIRAKTLEQHLGFVLVGVCDTDASRAGQWGSVPFFTSWRDCLQAVAPEVVFVCTVNRDIPQVVLGALALGCHVFAEKPPGRTLADVEAMDYALRQSHGLALKFGFNHRYHNAILEAKTLMDSGRFGALLWARGVYGKAGSTDFTRQWRADPELAGGGILLDQGIHMLDLMRLFLGEFSEVKAFISNCYWTEMPMEDNAFILLKSTQGKIAQMHSSATQWHHKFLLDLTFEDGFLSIDGLLTGSRSYGDERITFGRRQFENESRAFGRPKVETIFFDQDESWVLELEEFYHCIRTGETPQCGAIADAHALMSLVETIYRAGRMPGLTLDSAEESSDSFD